MPMAMLSGNGEELRRILLENGLTYISTRPCPAQSAVRIYLAVTPRTPGHLRGENRLAQRRVRAAG